MIRIPLTSYLVAFVLVIFAFFASLAAAVGALLFAGYAFKLALSNAPNDRKKAFMILIGLVTILIVHSAFITLYISTHIEFGIYTPLLIVAICTAASIYACSLVYDKVHHIWPSTDAPYPLTNIILLIFVGIGIVGRYRVEEIIRTSSLSTIAILAGSICVIGLALFKIKWFRTANLLPVFLILTSLCIVNQTFSFVSF